MACLSRGPQVLDGRTRDVGPYVGEVLGVPLDTVNNWRKGTKPRLSDLPRISEALAIGGSIEAGHDPTWLLIEMGLLQPAPEFDEVFRRAHQLQNLRLKELQALENMAAASGHHRGASTVLGQALRSGDWSVAIWPAVEGPADCQMRVADRVDLRRTNGAAVNHRDVWNDVGMRDALRASFAYPSEEQPRWSKSDEFVSMWTIPYVGAPRAPHRATRHPGFDALAFTALSVESRVHDVASLVSMAVGYGQSTTRDLALEVSGVTPGEHRRTAGRSEPRERRRAHQHFLSYPPAQRVWSHSALPVGTFPDPFRPLPDGSVVQIWLRESEALLQRYLDKWNRDTPLDSVLGHRDRLDTAARGAGVLVIDVDVCANSTARWEQTLRKALEVLQELSTRKYLDLSAREMERLRGVLDRSDPGVARPFPAVARLE